MKPVGKYLFIKLRRNRVVARVCMLCVRAVGRARFKDCNNSFPGFRTNLKPLVTLYHITSRYARTICLCTCLTGREAISTRIAVCPSAQRI